MRPRGGNHKLHGFGMVGQFGKFLEEKTPKNGEPRGCGKKLGG